MNIAMMLLLPAVALTLLMLPLVPVYRGVTNATQSKHRMIFHLCGFFGVCLLSILLPLGGFAFAAEAAPVVANAAVIGTNAQGMGFLAAALVTGLACLGAGIAVAAAAPAAIGATSEDPKAFGKALIFVALGEGVAIYGLLISILIINKL